MPTPSLSVLASFNAWLMPVSSPAYASRARTLGGRVASVLPNSSGLRVFCLQEGWCFQPGPCLPLVWLSSFDCVRRLFCAPNLVTDGIGFVAMIIATIWGTLMSPFEMLCPGITCLGWWNPRRYLSVELAKVGLRPVDSGAKGRFGALAILDHGLGIWASHPADASGFVPFSNDCSSEERLANKGILWALWRGGAESGTLVMNLHNKCASAQEDPNSESARKKAAAVMRELCGMLEKIMEEC
eukprot:Hpha_TRINITY_DN31397_c0_g1::TRINITY_DN31397_c0_g1_i1::g.194520::m.194520